MALKKQLVMGTDGLPQQLQAGDTVAGGTDTGQVGGQVAAVALLAGNAVFTSGADAINKAQANSIGTKDTLGLATTAIAATAAGIVQCNGVVVLTTAQWDAVAGTTGGLVFNTRYFLSPTTAGLLTATVPTTVGQYVAYVGRGLSTTEMLVEPAVPILL